MSITFISFLCFFAIMYCCFLLIFFAFFCVFIPFGHNISGDCVNIEIKQEPIEIKREQLDDNQATITEKMKMKILNEEFEIKNIGAKKESSDQKVKVEENEQLMKMEKFGNHLKGKSKSSAINQQKISASTSTPSSSLKCQVNSSEDDYVASLSEEEAESEDNSSDLEVTDDEELYDSSASKSLASSSLTNHQGREKLKKKSKSNKNVDNSREMRIIKQFDKLKEERVKKNNANRAQIDEEIAHELGVCRRTIYLWKKKLGLRCKKLCYPQKDKRIILQQFEKMKKEYKEKLIGSSCYETEFKIAKELGVDRSTITEWRKEFGLSKWRIYTEVEKLELIGKYREIKNRNPHLPYCKIAEKLNLPQRTIQRWIQEFRNKKDRETTTTVDFDSKDGSSSKIIQSPNNELWTWNMATKKRN